MRTGIIDRYASYLPVNENTPRFTLYEGETPLIYANKLSEELDIELYVKWEGANPTGSFKDRGIVMAVAKAMEEGSDTIMCASTGNTSASAAAYAARLGLRCFVVIPHGYVAMGKLSQAVMYGAEVLALEGNYDQALEMVRKIADEHPITLVNSVNPYRIEGQKTAAFEVCDQLGQAPDILALPVGGAGNITAYWKGFVEYQQAGQTNSTPQMWGFEAEGAAAIVRGEPIAKPETVATAIRIGNPPSWKAAEKARDESGGMIDCVSDEEILHAYRKIAQEGVFAEPGSCASIAGLIKMKQAGKLPAGKKVVCVLTGNGLKDPHTAVDAIAAKPRIVPCDFQSLEQEMLKSKEHEYESV